MGILIKYLEQKKRIILLHQIRTRCISVLTNLLIKYSKEKKIKKKSWTSWIKVLADKIEPFIDKSYQELAKYVNAYEQKMQMKREVIADKAIWVAKKRYILNSHDIEGVRYKEPKLKIMGVEAVKSSITFACREKIKDALKIIMNEDSKVLNSFIQDFRKDFMNLKPEMIYVQSVNGLNKWTESHNLFKKDIHCKGAILYNHLVKDKKLQGKYPYIQEGDKIKFLHMKTPNTYQSTSISFMTKLPEELNLHNIIDYDTQFEKSFIEPLKFITDIIRQIN